jgi:DNA-binding response OmpR family regulator
VKTVRILVVEDDSEMREELAELLSIENIEVFTAPNGLEGKRLVDGGDYSLVLLDLKLPDMEGTELLRHIKANSSSCVLVITGRPIDSDLEQLVEGEDAVDMAAIKLADGIIEKPFRIERLMDTIHRLISERDHPIP